MNKVSVPNIHSTNSGSIQKRKRQHGEESEQDTIDLVNALPLEEFSSRYIPRETFDLRIAVPISPETTRTGQKPDASTEAENRTYSMIFYSSFTIPQSRFEACYSLIEHTSSAAYKASSIGWSRHKKTDEMRLHDMRYLLFVRNNGGAKKDQQESSTTTANDDGKDGRERRRGLRSRTSSSAVGDEVGGFVSFMVTYEDSIPVLYCYELHLHPSLQRRGLGKVLVETLEKIARQVGGLQKVMLSVFRSNEGGRKFYERLGYSEDEFSPKPVKTRRGGTREWDYLILSKNVGI